MVSIVIPAYDMNGMGFEFLQRALLSARLQGECEIIVSDDSNSEMIASACLYFDAYYIRNTRTPGAAGNLNNAIDHARGDIIKILFQDDQLGPIAPFENLKTWGFCTSRHDTGRADHIPYHNNDIKGMALGCNTYGSPSALAFRKTDLRFDENLKWLLDCDFYARMQQRYGLPEIINTHCTISEWWGQATNTVATGSVRLQETEYINKKYADL